MANEVRCCQMLNGITHTNKSVMTTLCISKLWKMFSPRNISSMIYRIISSEQMVGQIYPTDLQLNKANSSDTAAPFLDLNLSITNSIVSSKIYDKRDNFNFEID